MALKDNLVSYWRLDEASTGVAPVTRFDSFGTNHLTDNNNVPSAAGLIGNGARFTAASSQYLNRASNSTLQFGGTDFEFQAWVKLTTKATTQFIIGKWGTALNAREYVLYYDQGADRFTFLVNDGVGGGAAAVANTLGSPSTGTWYFIHCWVVFAGSVQITVNNGAADTAVKVFDVNNGTSNFVLGRNDDGGIQYLNALLDEVGAWRRLLTAAERTQLYNGGAGFSFDLWAPPTPVPNVRPAFPVARLVGLGGVPVTPYPATVPPGSVAPTQQPTAPPAVLSFLPTRLLGLTGVPVTPMPMISPPSRDSRLIQKYPPPARLLFPLVPLVGMIESVPASAIPAPPPNPPAPPAKTPLPPPVGLFLPNFGGVWLAHLRETPMPAGPSVAPVPPGPAVPQGKPLLMRVRDTQSEQDKNRLGRITEILSSFWNYEVGLGVISQTGLDSATGAITWALRSGGFTAPRPPGAADDSTAGVTPGVAWIDTTAGQAYVNIANGVGSAVWRPVGGGGGGSGWTGTG